MLRNRGHDTQDVKGVYCGLSGAGHVPAAPWPPGAWGLVGTWGSEGSRWGSSVSGRTGPGFQPDLRRGLGNIHVFGSKQGRTEETRADRHCSKWDLLHKQMNRLLHRDCSGADVLFSCICQMCVTLLNTRTQKQKIYSIRNRPVFISLSWHLCWGVLLLNIYHIPLLHCEGYSHLVNWYHAMSCDFKHWVKGLACLYQYDTKTALVSLNHCGRSSVSSFRRAFRLIV